jgi:hypothetical protein
VAHPDRVDDKPACLGVLHEGLVQPRLERIGAVDDCRQVFRHQQPEHTSEERRRFEALNHRLGGLAERQPQKTDGASSRR